MILHIVMLVGGLVLILLGANFLTDGASSVAKRWGVSELVIGLTIVAFGTSAPELAISVLSSLQGNAELAVGNVVGSNIFNILVIVGVSALVFPLKVGRGIM
ncbi:sodium:calcium antiporter, partial [Muribaculum caecicola]